MNSKLWNSSHKKIESCLLNLDLNSETIWKETVREICSVFVEKSWQFLVPTFKEHQLPLPVSWMFTFGTSYSAIKILNWGEKIRILNCLWRELVERSWQPVPLVSTGSQPSWKRISNCVEQKNALTISEIVTKEVTVMFSQHVLLPDKEVDI